MHANRGPWRCQRLWGRRSRLIPAGGGEFVSAAGTLLDAKPLTVRDQPLRQGKGRIGERALEAGLKLERQRVLRTTHGLGTPNSPS